MVKLVRQLMTDEEYERFLTYVDFGTHSDSCHIWRGALANGYAVYSIDRAQIKAVRALWIYKIGPIPPKHQLDHICMVKACVNLGHVDCVTQSENQLRARAAARADGCKRGHDMDDPNNVYMDTRGFTECKECRRENVRAWRARQKKGR